MSWKISATGQTLGVSANVIELNAETNVSVNSKPITNVANPSGTQDAATKSYVDTLAADSMVIADTGNGHGAVNNKIRRFTNSTSSGSDITYADSSDDGASFTVNTTGVYSISYSDGGGSHANGISVNSAMNTTSILTLTIAQGKRAVASGVATIVSCGGVSLKLSQGDIVRPHTNGAPNDTSNNVIFVIKKMSGI